MDEVDALEITEEDPRTPDVAGLLGQHLDYARQHTPPQDIHALDAAGLDEAGVTFFAARADGRLLGVGALLELDPTHGEIKSMHTVTAARGRGVGRAMVGHLIGVAEERGYQRVSLETGRSEGFRAARALYRSVGFEESDPFADYGPSSYCMTLEL